MPSSWYLIDTWLSNPQGDDPNHVLFRKIDEEHLSTIKDLIAKVGDGQYVCDADWRKLRLVYLTPEGLSVLLELFGDIDGRTSFDVRVDVRTFTSSEITKIRCVIACPHCTGDEFWLNQFDIGKYEECDHQST